MVRGGMAARRGLFSPDPGRELSGAATGEVRIYASAISRWVTVRGAEDVCTRLGVAHRVTKLHPHRFRHTAGTIVQEELGDPR